MYSDRTIRTASTAKRMKQDLRKSPGIFSLFFAGLSSVKKTVKNGSTVEDTILNPELPSGGYALDTYYQHP